MYNETNETLGYNEHGADFLSQGNPSCLKSSAYPFTPPNTKGDLRATPRLAPDVMPRRRCNGTTANPGPEHSSKYGWGLEDYPLASVYSPYQMWREIYTPDVALGRGTLFSELDLPLEAINCRRGC